jgi:Tfp pilus assembly protein PilP
MDLRRAFPLIVIVLGAAVPPEVSSAAQTPAQQPAAPTSAPEAAPQSPAPPQPQAGAQQPAEAFSYNPEGRRDPFVSLLVRGGERSGPEVRPQGREGLLIGEVTLRGIVRSRAEFMAMLQGADNKTYIVRAGDRMLDGVVKVISADAVVFAQDVNDPLSLVKQREIRKALRVSEEDK